MTFTLEEMVQRGAYLFETNDVHLGHGADDAEDEALFLALHVLGVGYDVDASILQAPVTSEQEALMEALFLRRAREKIPAAYLTHKSYFCGLPFYVDERVLIPRSPIAELIIERFEPWVDADAVENILDLCTGSGCIGIACAYAFPDAHVTITDLSSDALAVARRNVEEHHKQQQITVFQSDVFAAIPEKKYDIIVSNPPYVCDEEMTTLSLEHRHEPAMALHAPDEGLAIVLRLLKDAARHLTPNGILVVEVGNSEDALMARLPQLPFIWLSFENGGQGVFLLQRSALVEGEHYVR